MTSLTLSRSMLSASIKMPAIFEARPTGERATAVGGVAGCAGLAVAVAAVGTVAFCANVVEVEKQLMRAATLKYVIQTRLPPPKESDAFLEGDRGRLEFRDKNIRPF